MDEIRALTLPTAAIIGQTRSHLGLTQSQCAELIHSSVSAWQKYEQDQRQMSLGLWELFLLKVGMTSLSAIMERSAE